MKLFYLILGATPEGRNTEQHDVFFGIAEELKDLVPYIKTFWPEAGGKIHLDGIQEVKFVDGYEIKISEKTNLKQDEQLFFLNLGGYRKGYFTEFHHQLLMVGNSVSEVVKRAKESEFYKTMGFPQAVSHIDDKYGVDIDDVFPLEDILPLQMKEKYSITLEKTDLENTENKFVVGYFPLNKM